MKLTQKQVEVLQLVAEGLSNKDIAARLHIAETTVKSTISRAYQRCGKLNKPSAHVKNRIQKAKELLRYYADNSAE